MKIINTTIALALSAMMVTPALAQEASPQESTALLYAGFSLPTDGYEDRYYTGVFVNKFVDDLGLHFDGAYVDREQNAGFAAVGGSVSVAPGVRPKLMVGASTKNRNILPEFFALGELRVERGKTIITPSVAYRSYRTGIEDVTVALDGAHYFNLPGDPNGYYAAQARGAYSIHLGKNAPAFGAGLSTVRNSGVSFGAYVEAGRLSYSTFPTPVFESTAVNSPFYSIRPNFAVKLSETTELTVRGEYSHNDFFDTRGALVGLKFNLN